MYLIICMTILNITVIEQKFMKNQTQLSMSAHICPVTVLIPQQSHNAKFFIPKQHVIQILNAFGLLNNLCYMDSKKRPPGHVFTLIRQTNLLLIYANSNALRTSFALISLGELNQLIVVDYIRKIYLIIIKTIRTTTFIEQKCMKNQTQLSMCALIYRATVLIP